MSDYERSTLGCLMAVYGVGEVGVGRWVGWCWVAVGCGWVVAAALRALGVTR
jgi:hypothetical protein